MKKLNRLQLRSLIEETVNRDLNEARFTSKGLGSVIRFTGTALGTGVGTLGTGGLGIGVGAVGGAMAGGTAANMLGYRAGEIPPNNRLALPHLVQYIEEEGIETPEELGAYIESVTKGKYGVEYDPEDFAAVPGSEKAAQLLSNLGGVRGGIGKAIGDKIDQFADFTGLSKFKSFFGDKEPEAPQGQEQAKDAFIEPPNTLDDLGEEPSTAERMKMAARRKQGRRL